MSVIPQVIHCCWFGGKPLTPLAQKCIESWNKYLPEYPIITWNEKTFDVDSVPFTQEAYNCKKYAFVSDYVRLWALYHYGGIYMDTDVEVISDLDKFMNFQAFSGFEQDNYMPTGIMAAVPHHPWIHCMLEHYRGRSFFNPDGTMDLKPNVIFMTELAEKEFGLKRGNELQILKDDVHIFPNDYFCPMVWETREIKLTPNTHTIHHFAYSWKEPGVTPD
ncbi:glycosyltransferase family 32 protein [Caproicibacterium amylolyticum]|uniref:Glycosyl transferase n=1 Tax=Caproicibacterium amylolyticum TaxID=2766537 RepID=A0A7G9WJR9_9FIRM|nr:glycosyltransferase [Caproicibacterium amylolyticum]QNO18931.1 glycosyl transferase [Caproicibacterium amylolyticum]